jgi:predicted nucleotidyltransferase component of viral defense system
MSDKDYRKLYQIQDKMLVALKPVLSSFYLTGGTALGRFYLNHRFSEDLDFFVNKSDTFHSSVKEIEKVLISNFSVLRQESIIYDDFVRFYIEDNESVLKIEFVNDIVYRCGVPYTYKYGYIDTPLNILTNKLTAIAGRDEPKDIYDIYTLAQHYMFNWLQVFSEAKNKAIINEIDVEKRIKSFPVLLFGNVDWHILPFDIDLISKAIQTIADDFFLGSDNSLGKGKPAIENARVRPVPFALPLSKGSRQ